MQNKLFFDIFQIYFGSASVSHWKPVTCNFKMPRKRVKTHRTWLSIDYVISRAGLSDLFTFLRQRPITLNCLALHAAREITSIPWFKLFFEVDSSILTKIALFYLLSCQRANVPFRFFLIFYLTVFIS